jgi:hypothetical protein
MKKGFRRLVFWFMGLALLLSLAAFAATYAWQTLGGRLNLSASADALRPSLVTCPVDATGTSRLCVAWLEPTGTINRVNAKYWDGQAWQSLGSVLNPGSMNNANSVALAAYPGIDDQGLFVAWADIDLNVVGAKSQLWVKAWNGSVWDWPTGSAASLNFIPGNSATNPSLFTYKYTSSYYSVAAWQENNGVNNQIFLKTWNTGLTTWTLLGEADHATNYWNYAGAHDALEPKLGYDIDTDEVFVVWREDDGTGKYNLVGDLCWSSSNIFSYNSSSTGIRFNTPGTTVQHANLAMDFNNPNWTYNEPVVVWVEGNTTTNIWTVRAARFTDNSGTYVTSPVGGAINDQTFAQNPSIYIGNDHVYYVAWEESAGVSGPMVVKVKRFNGTSWENVAGTVNNDLTQSAAGPSLSHLGAEQVSVAYAEPTGSGYHYVYVKSALTVTTPTTTATPAVTPGPTLTPTVNISSALKGVELAAFPNPAKDRVNFAFNTTQTGSITVSVYNTRFRLVKQIKDATSTGVGNIAWDVSDISPGIYFYEVTIGSHKYPKQKLVIAR